MILRFTIERAVAASVGNVIANYLDFEHTVFHNEFAETLILREAETTAALFTRVRFGPVALTNLAYGEYRPPNQVHQIIKTPVGLISNTVTVREQPDDAGASAIESAVEIEMPGVFSPLSGLIERYVRRKVNGIFEEDREILERRQRLFGNYIGDYLRDEQMLLFKRAFAGAFAHEAGRRADVR